MEHTIKLIKETRKYKAENGQIKDYDVLYLLIDNFIKVRFDYKSENYQNLFNLVKNNEKIVYKA